MSTRDRIEVGENLDVQAREWRAERLGWAAMAGLVVAGILGLFGNGLLSDVEDHSPDGDVTVEHERFVRRGAPTDVTVRVAHGGAGTVVLAVDDDFFRNVNIQRINPEPSSARPGSDGVVYEFRAVSGTETIEVRFRVIPDLLWSRDARMGVPNSRPAVLRQFVYP